MKNTKRITLRVSPEVHDELRRQACRRGAQTAQWVRHICEVQIQRSAVERRGVELRR